MTKTYFKLGLGKRGATFDNFYVLLAIFAAFITVIAIGIMWTQVSLTPLFDLSEVGPGMRSNIQGFVNSIDLMMLMFYIGIHLSVVVVGYLQRTHPVIFVIGFIFSMLLLMIAALLSNAWETMVRDGAFSVTAYPMSNFIMNNLVLFELGFCILTMIVLFGLSRFDDS